MTTKAKPKKPARKKVHPGISVTPERTAELAALGYYQAGVLAKEFGVGESTIRYWHKQGQLPLVAGVDEYDLAIKRYGARWFLRASVAEKMKLPASVRK